MSAKRQNLPKHGILWMVATPIGNLSDISERARQVLGSVDWVACEDTRRTAQLFSALSIVQPKLRRFDAHSDPAQVRGWVQEMRENSQSVACVTDAGTPGVSDPGALLVREAVAEGLTVSPVPGPSSWGAVVSISGWTEVRQWVFQGFFPRKSSERREKLVAMQASADESTAQVWLESPERLLDALSDFESVASASSQWLVAKELTKLHEKTFRGTLPEVIGELRAHSEHEGGILGEWCIAVRFPRVEAESSPVQPGVDPLVECLLDAGAKTSEIARIVSQRLGLEREKIYARALELKKNRGGG